MGLFNKFQKISKWHTTSVAKLHFNMKFDVARNKTTITTRNVALKVCSVSMMHKPIFDEHEKGKTTRRPILTVLRKFSHLDRRRIEIVNTHRIFLQVPWQLMSR